MSQCTYAFFHSSMNDLKTKCLIAKTECEFKYFNLLSLNYCSLNDLNALTIIFAVLFIAFSFYFIASTANKYLAPMLGLISEKMNLSQNLAGLTLLTLGNQAPDVIVAIISGADEHEGVSMALGTVLGSESLIIHVILSTVILLGKDFEIVSLNYIRDFGVYLFAIVTLCVYGFFKEIRLWQSILFFSFYIAYLVLAIVMDRYGTKMYLEEESWHMNDSVSQNYEIKLFKDSICVVADKQINMDEAVEQGYFYKRTNKTVTKVAANSPAMTGLTVFSKFQYGVVFNYLRWSETSWNERNTLQKVIYCLCIFPLDIIRDLTIPPFEKLRWNRHMFIAMPFTIPIFIIGVFRLDVYIKANWPYFAGFFGLMLILTIVLFMTTYRKNLPPYEGVLLGFGCVVSLSWIWGMSNMLLDNIKVIKMLLPIEVAQAFFTMTLVSAGNCLPDFFSDCTLAKTGFAEMAFSGAIGSPVFGLLIGFGISLIKSNIAKGSIPFDIFNITADQSTKSNKMLLSGFVFLITNLVRLLVEGFIRKFKLARLTAYIGYFFYLGFFICICYFAFS